MGDLWCIRQVVQTNSQDTDASGVHCLLQLSNELVGNCIALLLEARLRIVGRLVGELGGDALYHGPSLILDELLVALHVQGCLIRVLHAIDNDRTDFNRVSIDLDHRCRGDVQGCVPRRNPVQMTTYRMNPAYALRLKCRDEFAKPENNDFFPCDSR